MSATKQKSGNKDGFTLMELMVVVLLIGIIAAFAIPSYDRSVRKAHERDMVEQLKVLHAASLIYRANNGGYWDTAGGDENNLATINTALAINIIANDQTAYVYNGALGGGSYSAAATWDDFTVDIDEASVSATNPCCGTWDLCPSLPNC